LVLANEEPNREPKSSVSVFLVWFLVFSVRFSVLGIFCPGLRTGVGIAAMPGGGLRALLLLRQVTLYHPPLFLSILFLREFELSIIFIRIKSTLKT
jgi:hypothetical protein